MSEGLQQSSDMHQTVRLLDGLAERFGGLHEYENLRTPVDAIRLLCINRPGFAEELATAHEHGVGYQVLQAGHALDYPDLKLPLGHRELVIVPVISGAGGGVGKVLAGVGLVAAAIVLGPAVGGFMGLGMGLSGAGMGIIGAVAAQAVGAVGASLVFGGVAEMISPQPELPKGGNRFAMESASASVSATGFQGKGRGTAGVSSYAYTGATNTVGPGVTLPVAYGKVLIGSHLLSLRVQANNDTALTSTQEFVYKPGFDTVRINGAEVQDKYALNGGLRTRTARSGFVNVMGEGHHGKPSGESYRFAKQRQTMVITVNDSNLGVPKSLRSNQGVRNDKLGKGDNRYRNWEILFSLRNGLYNWSDRKNKDGLLPGWITYEVTLKSDRADGVADDTVLQRFSATIQGMLLSEMQQPSGGAIQAARYSWLHAVDYPRIKDDVFDIQCEVKITDFEIGDPKNNEDPIKLAIIQTGYNTAKDPSEHDSYRKFF